MCYGLSHFKFRELPMLSSPPVGSYNVRRCGTLQQDNFRKHFATVGYVVERHSRRQGRHPNSHRAHGDPTWLFTAAARGTEAYKRY